MIFGNPQTFAVLLNLKSSTTTDDCCNFAYIIAGQVVGNALVDAAKDEIVESVRHILADRGRRENCALFELENAQLITLVELGLSGDISLGSRPLDERWSGHSLNYDMRHGYLESLTQTWSVYVFECGMRARIIFRSHAKGTEVHDVHLPAGDVDRTLALVWSALTT